MKPSIYNIVIHGSSKDIIYNTLTGSIVRISSDKFTPQNPQLSQLGFFVEDDLNEYKTYMYGYMSMMFRRESMSITIATTLNCNLACPYCFEEGGKCNITLNEEVEKAIVQFIKSKSTTYKSIHIVWFGGEPLMNPESIIHISEALTKEEIPFTSDIVSNGTIINEYVIKAIEVGNISNIQITLDGLKEVHDEKRIFKSGKGSFDLIINNITKFLEQTKANIVIKSNLDKHNTNSYLDFKQLMHDKFDEFIKSNRLKLSLNFVRDRTGFDCSSACLTEKEFDIYKETKLGVQPFLPTLMGPCPMRSASSYIIGPDGSLFKCLEHLGHKDKKIGNIVTFKASSSKIAAYALLAFPFENNICKECSYLPICGGGCPIDRSNFGGNNISHCNYIKENITSTLIKLYHEDDKNI